MSALPLAILRRLSRSLVYQTVDSVLGKSLCVTSSAAVFDEVLAELSRAVAFESARPEGDVASTLGPLEKYGYLDLTYQVTMAPPTLPPASLGVLRSLGLVDASDPNPADWDHSILADLADDAEAGALYLKVFLQTVDSVSPGEGVRRAYHGLPRDFWPHAFLIEDACVTSVKDIWLAKHVYL